MSEVEEVKKHAVYAPSAMGRIIACPISIPLGKDLPDKKPSAYSHAGTLGHEVCEIYLNAKLANDPLPNLDDFPQYTAEMKSYAVDYTEFIYERVKQFLPLKHSWWTEIKLEVLPDLDCWGTADFLFVYRTKTKGILKAILIDYKYGEWIVVDTADNWQLKTYALGAVNSIASAVWKIHEVECHIYQPRVEFNAEPVTYSCEYLQQIIEPRIKAQINLISQWNNEFETIDNYPQSLFDTYQNLGEHCQFCKAQSRCSAYKNQTTANALDLFKRSLAEQGEKRGNYDNINELIEKGIVTDEELAFIALHASKIKNWIDAIPKAAMSLIAQGHKLPNIKVIETSQKRSWIGDTESLFKGLTALGIEEPKKLVEKWISISEVEKRLKHVDLAPLTTKTGPNYKIVDENHKKPPVKFGLDSLALFKSSLEEKPLDEE